MGTRYFLYIGLDLSQWLIILYQGNCSPQALRHSEGEIKNKYTNINIRCLGLFCLLLFSTLNQQLQLWI